MNLEKDGHNVLTENSQISEQNHVIGIPAPFLGVATAPSVHVSDSGIASQENLDFVTKWDFQLQMSNLQTVFRNSNRTL